MLIKFRNLIKSKVGLFFFYLFNLQPAFEKHLNMSPLDAGIDFAINNQVRGDYHEFGVYKGDSFIRAYKRSEMLQRPNDKILNKFYAYDSFAGLPESKDTLKPKQYVSGAYSAARETFERNLEKNNVPEDCVRVIEGWYDDVLNQKLKKRFNMKKASVIYIDCDIYESAKAIFPFITDLLQLGTVVVIDDWFRHKGSPAHGIQKAYYEWLKNNPKLKMYELRIWERVAFVVYEVDNKSN